MDIFQKTVLEGITAALKILAYSNTNENAEKAIKIATDYSDLVYYVNAKEAELNQRPEGWQGEYP